MCQQDDGAARGLSFTPSDEQEPTEEPLSPSELLVEIVEGSIGHAGTDAITVNHMRGTVPSGAAGYVDEQLGGAISTLATQGSLTGELGTVFFIPSQGVLNTDVVIVPGLGPPEEFAVSPERRAEIVQQVGWVTAQAATTLGLETIATIVHGAGAGGLSIEVAGRVLLEGFLQALGELSNTTLRRLLIVELESEKYRRLRDALVGTFGEHMKPMVRVQAGGTLSVETGRRRYVRRTQARLQLEHAPERTTTSPLVKAGPDVYLSVLDSQEGDAIEFAYAGPVAVAREPRFTLPLDISQLENFLSIIERSVR